MKIRWKIHIAGTVAMIPEGVQIGDVTELPDEEGARYCALHYAEPVVDKNEEKAVAPKGEERAEEPSEPVEESPKPRRGRPPAQ